MIWRLFASTIRGCTTRYQASRSRCDTKYYSEPSRLGKVCSKNLFSAFYLTGVHRAALLGRHVDNSNAQDILRRANENPPNTVHRRSLISFEADPTLVMLYYMEETAAAISATESNDGQGDNASGATAFDSVDYLFDLLLQLKEDEADAAAGHENPK